MTEYEAKKMNENIEAVRYITPEKPILLDNTKGAVVFLCILTIFFLILAISGSVLSLIIFIGFLALDIFLTYGTIIGYKEDMEKYNKNMDNIEEYRNTIMNNVREMHEKQSNKLQAEKEVYELMKKNNHTTTTKTENVPKCPTCGSTDISDISTIKRAVGIATVGLASSDLGKTKKCNKCGYKW